MTDRATVTAMAQLQTVVDDLDRVFELASAAPDIAMSRHLPRAFAAGTTMTLIGVSHAASEQLVLRTQLSRWFAERHGLTPHLLDEPQWWR